MLVVRSLGGSEGLGCGRGAFSGAHRDGATLFRDPALVGARSGGVEGAPAAGSAARPRGRAGEPEAAAARRLPRRCWPIATPADTRRRRDVGAATPVRRTAGLCDASQPSPRRPRSSAARRSSGPARSTSGPAPSPVRRPRRREPQRFGRVDGPIVTGFGSGSPATRPGRDDDRPASSPGGRWPPPRRADPRASGGRRVRPRRPCRRQGELGSDNVVANRLNRVRGDGDPDFASGGRARRTSMIAAPQAMPSSRPRARNVNSLAVKIRFPPRPPPAASRRIPLSSVVDGARGQLWAAPRTDDPEAADEGRRRPVPRAVVATGADTGRERVGSVLWMSVDGRF